MKEPDDIDRRLARVPMYHEVVQDLFTGRGEVASQIPDDAQFVRAYEDRLTRTFNFVFKSEEFDIVEECEEIPELEFEFSYYPQKKDSELLDGDGLY